MFAFCLESLQQEEKTTQRGSDDHDTNDLFVESSLQFKYLRCLEALFESTPQAVLQLVWVIRTGIIKPIFILSVMQSLLSLTNSMINSDNSYMTDNKKWKNYKKRFPIPHYNFLRHFLFRFAEISARIGLLALFWTVVGGFYVLIVLIPLEICFPVFYKIYVTLYTNDEKVGRNSWNDFFLSLQIIFAMPPEWMFETKYLKPAKDQRLISCFRKCNESKKCNTCHCGCFIIENCGSCALLCCCIVIGPLYLILKFFRILVWHPLCKKEYYAFPSIRITVSFIEWVIIISNYQSNEYLLSKAHGLYFFIASVVFSVIFWLGYPILMPDIRLLDNIAVRSIYGYAHLGNLDELEAIYLYQVPIKYKHLVNKIYNERKNDKETENMKITSKLKRFLINGITIHQINDKIDINQLIDEIHLPQRPTPEILQTIFTRKSITDTTKDIQDSLDQQWKNFLRVRNVKLSKIEDYKEAIDYCLGKVTNIIESDSEFTGDVISLAYSLKQDGYLAYSLKQHKYLTEHRATIEKASRYYYFFQKVIDLKQDLEDIVRFIQLSKELIVLFESFELVSQSMKHIDMMCRSDTNIDSSVSLDILIRRIHNMINDMKNNTNKYKNLESEHIFLSYYNDIINHFRNEMKKYWDRCVHYAIKGDQMKTAKWLHERGAKVEPKDEFVMSRNFPDFTSLKL